MKSFLLVGVGGLIGALLRYSLMLTAPDMLVLWLGNGIGSLVLGWLTGRAVATGKNGIHFVDDRSSWFFYHVFNLFC